MWRSNICRWTKGICEQVRSFNWSYYDTKSFHCSEMIIRRYNVESQFKYHHDDIIERYFHIGFKKTIFLLVIFILVTQKIMRVVIWLSPAEKNFIHLWVI